MGQMTCNSQALPLSDDRRVQIDAALRPECWSAPLPGIDWCFEKRSGSVLMGVASITQRPIDTHGGGVGGVILSLIRTLSTPRYL